MAVSIKDVAKKAGVSYSTVSRAFNGYSDIKEETKKSILLAAKELGYVPNLNARVLSGKNTKTMAVILSGFLADRGLTDELIIKMLRGASTYAECNKLEFATYILSSELQRKKTFDQFCAEHSLDGAMCFGIKSTDAYYEDLRNTNIPCVTVDVPVQGDNVGYVGTDNERAYEELTQFVLNRGHKRIFFLNGRREATVCSERLRGLKKALYRANLTLEGNEYTDFGAKQAEIIVTDYIEKHGTRGVTAFMCASDLIALGASKAIRKCGYNVGVEFSVAGFDGLLIADLNDPSISTIDQNMEQKGFAAAEMLHGMIMGKNVLHRKLLPYTLIGTRSVGVVKN